LRLRFSVSGDAAIERAYRTHWVSPEKVIERAEQECLSDAEARVHTPAQAIRSTLAVTTG
jgi:hypothetical protein